MKPIPLKSLVRDPLEEWAHIAAGVRKLVADLNKRGYETTDSGDGTNHKEGMECALPYRHVFGYVPDKKEMVEFADHLQNLYPEAHIEVNYSPGDGTSMFMVFPDGAPE